VAERRLGLVVGALFGAPIGVLSGFTGVGGGEYRAPVLLSLLGRVRWAIAANLLIGVAVASFNVLFRQVWLLAPEYVAIGLLMVPLSLPGAYLGALLTKRISTPVLKGLLAGILVATGLVPVWRGPHLRDSIPLPALPRGRRDREHIESGSDEAL